MFDLVSYIRDLRSHNYLHMNQPPPFLVEYAISTQQLSLSSSPSDYMHMLDDGITSLIGLVCEAVLYGMYCILFMASVALTFWRTAHHATNNRFVAYANLLLFAVCTTHFAMTFNGFWTILGSTGVKGYGDETPHGIGENLLISVADWIGELILIYRCWVIWGRNYYIVLAPFVAATAALGCFAAAINLLLKIDPTSPQPPPAIAPLVLAAYILPLCSNFLLTALIVGRIWHLSPGSLAATLGKQSVAFRAGAIIVESGLLYFIVQLILLTVFALHNTADEIMSLVAVQIYGIAPTLIVIQVGLGLTTEETAPISLTIPNLSMAESASPSSSATSGVTSEFPSPFKTLASPVMSDSSTTTAVESSKFGTPVAVSIV